MELLYNLTLGEVLQLLVIQLGMPRVANPFNPIWLHTEEGTQRWHTIVITKCLLPLMQKQHKPQQIPGLYQQYSYHFSMGVFYHTALYIQHKGHSIPIQVNSNQPSKVHFHYYACNLVSFQHFHLLLCLATLNTCW